MPKNQMRTGIQQTWAFAHPNNRAVTGPIERFAKMLKNKNYRYLLGHKEYKIREVVVAPKIANFLYRYRII